MEIFIFIIMINMALTLLKMLYIKNIGEKIMLANFIASNAFAVIIMLSIYLQSAMIIDIALVYIMISFVGLVAFLQFFVHKKNRNNANI